MSFFGKLKDRLFKTSSKIDAGVEAIVEEGEETTAPAPAPAPAPEPEPAPAPKVEAKPEPKLGPYAPR